MKEQIIEAVQGLVTYEVELCDRNGNVLDKSVSSNLTPLEGRNFILNVMAGKVPPPTALYIGLYEGDYTPIDGISSAQLVTDATECTTYDEARRVEFVTQNSTNGTLNNVLSVAEFSFSNPKLIFGGFISTSSAKGSSVGNLLSITRFTSPKQCDADTVLRVSAGFTLISVS